MKSKLHRIFHRLAIVGYSLGTISLMIGLILSVAVQPVSAAALTGNNSKGGDDHKIWICHIPPGNPNNGQAINVDEDGWNGHDHHPDDFKISGPNDPSCGHTSTDVPPTAVPTTEVPPTVSAIPPTEEPTTVIPVTGTPEVTATSENTEKPSPTLPPEDPTEVATFTATLEEPSATPTEIPTATDTFTPTFTETATFTGTPTETLTPTELVQLVSLKLNWVCVSGTQVWTVTNSNNTPIGFSWVLDNASTSYTSTVKLASLREGMNAAIASGNLTAPANSQVSWSTSTGYHTMKISWNASEETRSSLSVTTSEQIPCLVPTENATITNTPEQTGSNKTQVPGATATPSNPGTHPTVTPFIPVTGSTSTTANKSFVYQIATLTPVPGDPNATEAVLIPVTGLDLSTQPISTMPLSNVFVNLGIVMLGIAFSSHGISIQTKDE